MDDTLYDEFGNYAGPELSDSGSDADDHSDSDEQSDDDVGSDNETRQTSRKPKKPVVDEDDVIIRSKEEDEKLEKMDMGDVDEGSDGEGRMDIVLHEDKKYYPEASEIYGEQVEILHEEEDTQPIEKAVIEKVKVKSYLKEEKKIPKTIYKKKYMVNMMDNMNNTRSVSICGHLHHGKTSLVDLLVENTHLRYNKNKDLFGKGRRDTSIENSDSKNNYNNKLFKKIKYHKKKHEKDLKYTDLRYDEHKRGLGIKSTPISLLLNDSSEKSFLHHMIDTPGHLNFHDEVLSSCSLSDGIVLVVDALEGVMYHTELIIKYAVLNEIPMVLVLNKVDRLLLELKLPPEDAYFKLKHTISEVNEIVLNYKSEFNEMYNDISFDESSMDQTSVSNGNSTNSKSSKKGFNDTRTFSPAIGNVCFASCKMGFIFSLESFAQMYLLSSSDFREDGVKSFEFRVKTDQFKRRLWGDVFYDEETRKFTKSKRKETMKRSFVQFVLEPIYKIFSHVVGQKDSAHLKETILDKLNIEKFVTMFEVDNEQYIDATLKKVFYAFFNEKMRRVSSTNGSFESNGIKNATYCALTDMINQFIPNPQQNNLHKLKPYYTGPFNTKTNEIFKSMKDCDPTGPLVIHVPKLLNDRHFKSFYALGRIVSGTLKQNDELVILGPNFNMNDPEDMTVEKVSNIYVSCGRYKIAVNRAIAGNIVLLEGIDSSILKCATIMRREDYQKYEDKIYIFKPLSFQNVSNNDVQYYDNFGELSMIQKEQQEDEYLVSSSMDMSQREKYIISSKIDYNNNKGNCESVMKIAVEPLNPSELPKMLEALRKINKSYSAARTVVEESGEYTILGTGELYLDCILYDIRKIYGQIEVKVSDPLVSFGETVLETSSIKCFAHTPNKQNKLTMICEPVEKTLSHQIEKGYIDIENWDLNKRFNFFERYSWDILESQSVWSFGPNSYTGTNIFSNETIEGETNIDLLNQVKPSIVQGFKWSTREGPLCDEPVRNVKFRLMEAELAENSIHRTSGQIIPTARRVAYSSMLMSNPRLMEPIMHVEIQAPMDTVKGIYNVLERRRGHVTEDKPKPGTPLYIIKALVPAIDSYGLETDIRSHTQGQAFCMSMFHHYSIVPGNPLDKSIVLRPLEPSPINHLAREFMIKTRKRKGLTENVDIVKYFDDQDLLEIATKQIIDV